MTAGKLKSSEIAAAHRYFSVDCFNQTWTLMEKTRRTPADNQAMVLGTLTSLWHWTQRRDCTDRNRSIAHWQVSRVHALTGDGANAMRHARLSLHFSRGLPPFFVGYSHEAIARAALVLKESITFATHLKKARACARAVTSKDERSPLERDLRKLQKTKV